MSLGSPTRRTSLLTGGLPTLLVDVPFERLQRRRSLTPQRPDLRAVVVVGDRPGPVVELELLECGERAVARLERARDDAARPASSSSRASESGSGSRRNGSATTTTQATASAAASSKASVNGSPGVPTSLAACATSRRCSRASGQSVMTEPRRKTSPASQMRLTSGLTKTRKYDAPVRVDLLGDHEEILARQLVAADPDLVRDLLLDRVGVLAGLERSQLVVAAADVATSPGSRSRSPLPLVERRVDQRVAADRERLALERASPPRPSRTRSSRRPRSRAGRSPRERRSRRSGGGCGR